MATELLKGQSSSYVDPRVKAVQQEQFDLGDLDGDGKNEFAQLGVTQVSINCAQNESPLSPSITYIDPSMSVGLQSEFAGVLDTFCGEHPTSSVKFDCNPRDFWNQNYEAGDINPSACYAGFSAVGQGYDDPGLNPELRANLPGSLYSSLLPITWSRQTGLINKTISVQEPGNGGKLITGKIIDVRTTRVYPLKRAQSLLDYMLNNVSTLDAGRCALAVSTYIFSNSASDRQDSLNVLRDVMQKHLGEVIMENYDNSGYYGENQHRWGNKGSWPRGGIGQLDLALFDEYVPLLLNSMSEFLGPKEETKMTMASLIQNLIQNACTTMDIETIRSNLDYSYEQLIQNSPDFYEHLDQDYNFSELYVVIAGEDGETHLVRVSREQVRDWLPARSSPQAPVASAGPKPQPKPQATDSSKNPFSSGHDSNTNPLD